MRYGNTTVDFVGNKQIKNKADEFRIRFWKKHKLPKLLKLMNYTVRLTKQAFLDIIIYVNIRKRYALLRFRKKNDEISCFYFI